MAGRKHLLISAFTFAAVALPLLGDETRSAPNPGHGKPGGKRAGKNAGPESPEFDNVHRAIDALTPEQRRRFQENFARWINLSPEEKRALRERDDSRRKQMRQEIDNAIEEAGLQLSGEQRLQFAKRYAQERKNVEEQLRREMQEKRQPRLREIIGKLKEEFQQQATASTP